MNIDCCFTHQYFSDLKQQKNRLNDLTVVAIDILRATSSLTTALAHGALKIYATDSIGEALTFHQQNPDSVLSGERNGNILRGFDLGNSPKEFSCENVGGRILISCTTNGTKAIQTAKSSKNLLLGSILNASAVTEALLAIDEPILFLCAGTTGSVSLDDILGAGLMIELLLQKKSAATLTDAAAIAHKTYQIYQNNLLEGLQQSAHGRKLTKMKRGNDLILCSQKDLYDTVPVYDKKTGFIIKK